MPPTLQKPSRSLLHAPPIPTFPLSSPITEEIDSPTSSSEEREEKGQGRERPYEYLGKSDRKLFIQEVENGGRSCHGSVFLQGEGQEEEGRKKMEKPVGLNLVTDFTLSPPPPPKGKTNTNDGTGFIDLNDLKQLSKTREKERTAQQKIKGILKKGTGFDRTPDESQRQSQRQALSSYLDLKRRSRNKKKDDLSPSDRPIMIGFSGPFEDSDPRDKRELDVAPPTPSIIITPARDDGFWSDGLSPEDARPRVASSVYSQPTPCLDNDEVPPVPALPALHSVVKGEGSVLQSTSRDRAYSTGTVFEEDDPPNSAGLRSRPFPNGTKRSKRNIDRLSVNTDTNRHQSQGWWTYLLSPLLNRSSMATTPRTPTTPKRPPVPALLTTSPQSSVDWWEKGPSAPSSKEKEISCFSPDTPETAVAERDMTIGTNPFAEFSSVNVNEKHASMFPGQPIQGEAAEYYQACASELFSGRPYFECVGHDCEYTRGRVAALVESTKAESGEGEKGLAIFATSSPSPQQTEADKPRSVSHTPSHSVQKQADAIFNTVRESHAHGQTQTHSRHPTNDSVPAAAATRENPEPESKQPESTVERQMESYNQTGLTVPPPVTYIYFPGGYPVAAQGGPFHQPPVQPAAFPAPVQQPVQPAVYSEPYQPAPAPVQLPVHSSPVQREGSPPAPVQGAPVPELYQPAPVHSSPGQTAWFQPAPVQSGPAPPAAVYPEPYQPAPVHSSPVQRETFQPAPAYQGPFQPAPVYSSPVQPAQFQPGTVQAAAAHPGHFHPATQPVPAPVAPAYPEPCQVPVHSSPVQREAFRPAPQAASAQVAAQPEPFHSHVQERSFEPAPTQPAPAQPEIFHPRLVQPVPAQATAHLKAQPAQAPTPFQDHSNPAQPQPERSQTPVQSQQTERAVPFLFVPQSDHEQRHLPAPASPGPISPGYQQTTERGGIAMGDMSLPRPAPAYLYENNHNSMASRMGLHFAGVDTSHPVTERERIETQRRRLEKEEKACNKKRGLWRNWFKRKEKKDKKEKKGCFGRSDKKGKDGKDGRGKLKRRWYFAITAFFLTIIIIAILLAILLTRKGSSASGPTRWLNLTGYPPMYTGISTIAGAEAQTQNSGCITPSTLWSCALPKEDQAANKPYNADEPNFRLDIRFLNGTYNHSTTLASRSDGFTPSPSPPSLNDQTFLGNTTDHNASPFVGEETPFYISLLSTTPMSPSLSKRSTVFPNLSSIIPSPDTNSDGTAAAAQLYPFPEFQPIRLYNRGQDDEHYGFYTYFDKSIFLESEAALTGVANDTVDTDKNGGSAKEDARVRCTWSQTRFLVQIWTQPSKSKKQLLPSPTTSSTASPTPSSTSDPSTDPTRPGSFPYPVTLTLDRHGGLASKKMVYCYGMESNQSINSTEAKLQVEQRGFGGTLVNAAPGLFSDGSEEDSSEKGNGNVTDGVDGGTGGCSCKWVNWESS